MCKSVSFYLFSIHNIVNLSLSEIKKLFGLIIGYTIAQDSLVEHWQTFQGLLYGNS